MVLARMADGALRDGVSLLDQCASAATGPVTAEVVYQCLGLAGEQKGSGDDGSHRRKKMPGRL